MAGFRKAGLKPLSRRRVTLDSPRDRTEVALADLKAIFFLKAEHVSGKRRDAKTRWTRVKVLFADGKELVGYTYA